MSIKRSANKPYQIKYLKVYLATRKNDNTYDTYFEIPKRYIINNSIEKSKVSIDSSDFDIGYNEESDITITLDNIDGKFTKNSGYFINKLIDRSKIKLNVGYYNTDSIISGDESGSGLVAEYATTFEGIIEERSVMYDINDESVKINIVSFSSILRKLKVNATTVSTGNTFIQAFDVLLNRNEITELLTYNISNIDPELNLTIDNGAWFDALQMDEAIYSLLLASNSILKIKDNTIYIVPRNESASVKYEFFAKGAPDGKVNVISIKELHEGLRRVITRLNINDTNVYESDDWIRDKYGSLLKDLEIGFMTDESKLRIIATNILTEFQFPKREFYITTDFIANEAEILDLITVENSGYSQGEDSGIYDFEESKYDTDNTIYAENVTGIVLYSNYGYKILSIEHNYKKFTTRLKVRMIGVTESDGLV